MLSGGADRDVRDGGTGNDRLDGSAGADTLSGGMGSDVFVLRAHEAEGDMLMDFNEYTDRLGLHGYGADAKLRQQVDGPGEVVRGVWEIYEGQDVIDAFYGVAKFSNGLGHDGIPENDVFP